MLGNVRVLIPGFPTLSEVETVPDAGITLAVPAAPEHGAPLKPSVFAPLSVQLPVARWTLIVRAATHPPLVSANSVHGMYRIVMLASVMIEPDGIELTLNWMALQRSSAAPVRPTQRY